MLMVDDYLVRAEGYNKSGFARIKRFENITFCNLPGKQGKPFFCSPYNHLNKYIASYGIVLVFPNFIHKILRG